MTDWSKIGKNARRKGGRYERKICNLLTDLSKTKFRRAPRSGALIREGKINGLYISGDLVAEQNFKFSIECKNRQKINLESILKSPSTSEFAMAWHQCIYDAKISSKLPLMFINLKRHDFICLDNDGMKLIDTSGFPVMYINDFINPVTQEIGKEDVTLDLPGVYVTSAKALSNVEWKLLFE